MTTSRGQVRVLNLIRKYGSSLFSRALERCHLNPRSQAKLLIAALGDEIECILTELIEEEQQIDQWTELIERNNARDKLICTVFNDLSHQAQDVVMKGPEAQLRYITDKYGRQKAQKLVENLTKSELS